MTKTQRIKLESKQAAEGRGHEMSRFVKSPSGRYFDCYCKKCEADLRVTPNPLPNEILVCGLSVAVNCEK